MAHKEGNDFVPESNEVSDAPYSPDGGMDLGSFNVEEEFKPMPLIAGGIYHGAITDVKFDNEKKTINFHTTLNENGGYMSDGETPVDGTTHVAKVWLPKPGDESDYTKDGKMTKRQAKINMMKRFADNLKIDMTRPEIIASAIMNGEWLGRSVDVKLKISEYEGQFRNEVERLVARMS